MYKIKLVGLFYSWYALKMIELKTSVLRSHPRQFLKMIDSKNTKKMDMGSRKQFYLRH